jgi:hypothetical protein
MPFSEDESDSVWDFIGALEYEVRGGEVMIGGEGTMLAARIGARFVTDDDSNREWQPWSPGDDGMLFFSEAMEYPEYMNYRLYRAGQSVVESWTDDDEDEFGDEEAPG